MNYVYFTYYVLFIFSLHDCLIYLEDKQVTPSWCAEMISAPVCCQLSDSSEWTEQREL